MTRRLLLFAAVYSSITAFFFWEIPKGEHGSPVLIPVLFLFWTISAFFLFALYRSAAKANRSGRNIFLLVFCTPVPALIYFLAWLIWIEKFEKKSVEKVYIRNGYIVKEISFPYQKRNEFWSNYDSPNNEYRLDSVIYFNTEEKKFRKDIYMGWERIRGNREQAKLPTEKK